MGFSPQDIEGMLDELEKSRLITPLKPEYLGLQPGAAIPNTPAPPIQPKAGMREMIAPSPPSQPQPASAGANVQSVEAKAPSTQPPEDEFSKFSGKTRPDSLPKGAKNVKAYKVIRDPDTGSIDRVISYTMEEDQADGA